MSPAPARARDGEHDVAVAVAEVQAPLAGKTRTAPRRRGRRSLEVEADVAADALLAGGSGLARSLTPTAAARAPGTGEPGRPLPPRHRQRLEHGFGADLSRVRVHTGARATTVAQAEGATAFAAGPDIVFAAGAYRPDTEAGFRLLAHETAHVLQQTARATTGSRVVRATDVTGEAPVQAQDAFLDWLGPHSPAEQLELVTDHHGGTGAGSPVADVATRVGARLGGVVDPTSAAFQDLAREVVAEEHDVSGVPERSWLLDVLKAGRAWDAAASLIEDSPETLWTAGGSSTFGSWLLADRGPGWPSGALASHEPLRDLRNAVYWKWRVFLMRPDLGAPAAPTDRVEAVWQSPGWALERLVPDDRVQLAALWLGGIDEWRRSVQQAVATRAEPVTLSTDEAQRAWLGSTVATALRRSRLLAAVLEDARPAVEASGEPLAAAALGWFEQRRAEAEEFWTAALERWQGEGPRRRAASRGELTDEARAQLEGTGVASGTLRAVHDRLRAAAPRLLTPAEADLPAPAAYAARIDAFVDQLRTGAAALRLVLSRDPLERSRPAMEAAVWLLLRVEELQAEARSYRTEEDIGDFDDTRQGHRLRMASLLRVLAVEFADEDLERLTLAVLHSEALGQSRLVLLGDWQDEPDVDPGRLPDDFPEGIALSASVRVPARAWVDFYRERYFHRIAQSLAHDLRRPAAETSDRLVVEAAVTAAARQRPVRWSVAGVDWAPHPDEDRSVMKLIQEHPKTRHRLDPVAEDPDTVIAYPGRDVIASSARAPSPFAVFAWQLPELAELLVRVAEGLARLDVVRDALGPVGDDAAAYVADAEAVLAGAGDAAAAAASAHVSDVMAERLDVEAARLGLRGHPPGLLRAGTTRDRGVVARQVRLLLRVYAEDPTVAHWQQPVEALDRLAAFHRYALPLEDSLAQTAALVVDIAPELQQAFVREAFWGRVVTEESRYDLVTGWYGFVLLVDQWLSSPSHRRTLRADFLHLGEEELARRHEAVSTVRQALERVRTRVQTGHGFVATSGGSLRSLAYPFEIPPGERFGWGGGVVELVEVRQPFTFHPQYGTAPASDVTESDEPQLRHGAHSPAQVLAPDGADLAPETVLLELRVNEQPTRLRAGDVEQLDTLWRAVEDKAFALSMENLEAALVEMGTLVLDAAEFVPGAGQALAVGRIVFAVSSFLASADFADIREALSGDIQQQVEGFLTDLDTMLSPEQIWLFLLFEDSDLLSRLRARAARGSAHGRRLARRRRGKLARLLRTVGSLGSLLARQVEGMRERVQPPLRDTQSLVATHPALATVMTAASNLLATGALQDVADVADQVRSLEGRLSQRLESMVEAIEGFELPQEILPLDVAVSAVVSVVLERLGRKARVVELALERTGALDEIARLVADELSAGGLDPNVSWQEEMLPLVDRVLDDARRDFLDGIYGTLAQLGLEGLGRPADRRVRAARAPGLDRVDEEADAAPEGDAEAASAAPSGAAPSGAAQPALAPGVLADVHPALGLDRPGGDLLPPGPGAPLPAALQRRAETRFGRPFDHVRLHRTLLAPGIDGLTRGSHVVVRPGLSLEGGRGRHVLDHELTHVVQQGTPGATRATRGTPGPALRVDPAAEREAERMATLAGSTSGALPRIGVTGSDAAAPGLAPDVLARVFDRLADFHDLRAFQRSIQDPTTVLENLTAEQDRAVGAMRTALHEALTDRALDVDAVPPSGSGRRDIRDLVREHVRTWADRLLGTSGTPEPDFVRLARQSLRRRAEPRRRRTGSTPPPAVLDLVPDRFAALVEGYFQVRAGIQLDVDVTDGIEAFLDAARRRVGVTFKGLFLGAVTGNSRLWRAIVDHQMPVGATVQGRPVPSGPDDGSRSPVRHAYEITDAEAQTRLHLAVKAHIRARGPRERATHASRFELLPSVLWRAVDDLAVGTDVDVMQLPRPAEYVRTRYGADEPSPVLGLRVSTHGRLSDLTTVDRDSHHTTQYLLAEYFTHRKTVLPFRGDEPGLEYRSGRPHTLHGPTDSDDIRFADVHGPEGGRGRPMPAILLARPTHTQGDLHVGRSGQVDSWWRSASGGPAGRTLTGTRSVGEAEQSVTVDDASRAENATLREAVHRTYTRMRNAMLGRLDDALETEEKPYYETLAGRRGDAREPGDATESGELKEEWRISSQQLAAVHRAATENNDEEMQGFGFRVVSGA